jgi:hypothetical protein
MLGYRLGSHVACFGDGPSPRHLKGCNFEKVRNLEKTVLKCIRQRWITFDSLSIETHLLFLKVKKHVRLYR